jgi:hypothetical protein
VLYSLQHSLGLLGIPAEDIEEMDTNRRKDEAYSRFSFAFRSNLFFCHIFGAHMLSFC